MDAFDVPQGIDPSLLKYIGAILNKLPAVNIPSSLVRSDYLPTPEARDNIEEKIFINDIRVYSLMQELQHLQVVTSALEAKKELLEKYSAYQRSLLSPIRKLPCEILGRIFIYMSDIDLWETSPGDFWDIQLVCMRWRHVIRSTPLLWTNFKISTHKQRDNAVDNVKPTVTAMRMKLCLGYSRALPLSIYLRPPPWSFPISIMENLAEHCNRWEDFSIDSQTLAKADGNTKLGEIITNKRLPMLRKLVIADVDYDRRNRRLFSFDIYSAAKSVEELDLFGTEVPGVDEFSWTNLRKLKLDYCFSFGRHTLFSVLRATPLLEELFWRSPYDNDTTGLAIHSSVIKLPYLRSLTLRYRNLRDEDPVHPGLRPPTLFVPRLKALALEGCIRDFDTLLYSIESSGSVITRVEMHDSSMNFIFWVIEQLPNIEELKIRRCCITHESDQFNLIIRRFIRNASDLTSDILPSLRKLEVEPPSDYTHKAVDSLVDVIRSRTFSPHADSGVETQSSKLSHVTVNGKACRQEYPLYVYQLEGAEKKYGIKVQLNFTSSSY